MAELEETMVKRVLAFTSLIVIMMIPPRVTAQGCAVCYTQAGSSGPKMIRALKEGIFILAFPPIAICLVIAGMAYRKRNNFSRFHSELRRRDRYSRLGW
jgi:hypothetical protein